MRDEYKPEGPRPDLSWAQTYHLSMALWELQREHYWESDRCDVRKVVGYQPDGWPNLQYVEVDAYWVRLELKERNERDHLECMARMKRCSTRELLKIWLHVARISGYYSPCESGSSIAVSYDDIKIELATRPHIPGKLEARKLRREAALQHRGNKRRGPVAQRSRAVSL